MKTFKQITEQVETTLDDVFGGMESYILSESIHTDIQTVMDSEKRPHEKLNTVGKTVRKLIAKGEDTGLESDKPKKGSSRAVFFPRDQKKIKLDGKDVTTPSVVKIAFPSKLDKYTGDSQLLGEHQNQVESDYFAHRRYGVIHENEHGGWDSNDEGILPPHFGHHEDYHHLEMGRVSPITAKGFREATKHKDFPKGITHTEFLDAVKHNWLSAHGHRNYSSIPESRIQELQEHPLVQNVTNFIGDTDNSPDDMVKRNMGLWKHPVTGKNHVVLSDFGGSNKILRLYTNARRKEYESR